MISPMSGDGLGEEGTHTSMDTKYIIINDDTQRQKIKHIRKIMPDIRISIFPITFRIEPITLGNPSTFMIPTNQMHPTRPPELIANEQTYRLYAKEAAVNVVA